MSKKGVKQAFTNAQYTPSYLSKQNVSVLKSDYTRLRDIMQKRYKRLAEKGYQTNFTRKVEQWGGIPKLRDMQAMYKNDSVGLKNELSWWLSELKSEENEETTVKYQTQKRKELSKSLQESGYDVSMGELDDFGEFMEYLRSTGIDKAFYSETYRDADIGYRDRNERTDTEKKALIQAFDKWKQNKSFDIVTLMLFK